MIINIDYIKLIAGIIVIAFYLTLNHFIGFERTLLVLLAVMLTRLQGLKR